MAPQNEKNVFEEFLKKCTKCSDDLEMKKLRDDFNKFVLGQVELNTTISEKIKVVDEFPVMSKNLNRTMGGSIVVGILLVFLLNTSVGSSNDIIEMKTNLGPYEIHMAEARSEMVSQKKKDIEFTILKEDVKSLKEKQEYMNKKLDDILKRLPPKS